MWVDVFWVDGSLVCLGVCLVWCLVRLEGGLGLIGLLLGLFFGMGLVDGWCFGEAMAEEWLCFVGAVQMFLYGVWF